MDNLIIDNFYLEYLVEGIRHCCYVRSYEMEGTTLSMITASGKTLIIQDVVLLAVVDCCRR